MLLYPGDRSASGVDMFPRYDHVDIFGFGALLRACRDVVSVSPTNARYVGQSAGCSGSRTHGYTFIEDHVKTHAAIKIYGQFVESYNLSTVAAGS